MENEMQSVRLFLLDLDGTFYLGERLLPGAREFLARCREKGVAYTFLTNNSSRGKEDYLKKLARLGVAATPGEMYSSADATLRYLADNRFPPEVALFGTPSLEAQFAAAGYELNAARPKTVVLGFDTTLTYQKLVRLCNLVRAGLPYVATHPDLNCPVEGGFVPDIGATLAFVKASTGREPDVVIGKPNGLIARAAAEAFGVALEDVCMVGDRLYTDIALGACGCKTALVLCGESSLADYEASGLTATVVCRDLAALCALL